MYVILIAATLVLIVIQFVLFIQFIYQKKSHLLKPITIVFILLVILMLILITAFY